MFGLFRWRIFIGASLAWVLGADPSLLRATLPRIFQAGGGVVNAGSVSKESSAAETAQAKAELETLAAHWLGSCLSTSSVRWAVLFPEFEEPAEFHCPRPSAIRGNAPFFSYRGVLSANTARDLRPRGPPALT